MENIQNNTKKKKKKLWLLLVKKKLPNNTHASFSFFFLFFLIFLVPSHHSANELKNMCSVKTECWSQKFWKSLRLDSMEKMCCALTDCSSWKHMYFLTSGSLVFVMGFGSLCLSPDTTLRTALTSTGTPLDDWSWHLAFLVGKGGFRYAPKRSPVWHRLRLEGLAHVGQNHLCRFSRVFQSSCLRLTLATRWLRGVVRHCWGTANTLCQSQSQSHVVEESFDSPRVCTCRSNCFLSFLSLHLPCPALFF